MCSGGIGRRLAEVRLFRYIIKIYGTLATLIIMLGANPNLHSNAINTMLARLIYSTSFTIEHIKIFLICFL